MRKLVGTNKTGNRIAMTGFGGGGWIRPTAVGPGRGENMPPACFLTPLPSNLDKNATVPMERLHGGGGWIRTIEVVDNRFTVCPLWPLGNSSI